MFEQGQIFADRYTIEELLGEGGFSYVFKATQLGLGRPVALKIIHARRLNMPLPDSSNQQLERLHERFEQEARTISRLASPHTVTLYDYGIDVSGAPFMVLEYIDGMDLSDLIFSEGPQPPERVIEIMRQVLESLAEAHAYGLLHRDIKPANIVMTRDVRGRDQVKLLDFGLAKVFASGNEGRRDLTSESQIIGTPRYMSPEQIMTPRELTAASDLYSLGLVGYELLTGRPAVDGVDTMSLIAAQISNDSFAVGPGDGAPPALASVVNRMLSKAATDRYASAVEVLAALDAAGRPGALAAPAPAAARPGVSTERKLIFATFAIILLACVLGGVAFVQSSSADEADGASASAEPAAGSAAGAASVASKEPRAGATAEDDEQGGDEQGGDGATAEGDPASGGPAEGDPQGDERGADLADAPAAAPEDAAPEDAAPEAKGAEAPARRARKARVTKKKPRPEPEVVEPPKKKTRPKVDAFIMEP